jgi:hypothetical protein
MRTAIILVLIVGLFSLFGCSQDETDKNNSTTETNQSAPSPANLEPKVPYPNSANPQDLQPDVHLSGVQQNHASGAAFLSEHVSGQ